jgi:hypothetical protein
MTRGGSLGSLTRRGSVRTTVRVGDPGSDPAGECGAEAEGDRAGSEVGIDLQVTRLGSATGSGALRFGLSAWRTMSSTQLFAPSQRCPGRARSKAAQVPPKIPGRVNYELWAEPYQYGHGVVQE